MSFPLYLEAGIKKNSIGDDLTIYMVIVCQPQSFMKKISNDIKLTIMSRYASINLDERNGNGHSIHT